MVYGSASAKPSERYSAMAAGERSGSVSSFIATKTQIYSSPVCVATHQIACVNNYVVIGGDKRSRDHVLASGQAPVVTAVPETCAFSSSSFDNIACVGSRNTSAFIDTICSRWR